MSSTDPVRVGDRVDMMAGGGEGGIQRDGEGGESSVKKESERKGGGKE